MGMVIISLEGSLIASSPLRCIVEVQGIGYEVFIPLTTNLPKINEKLKLWIYTIYREDSQSLYGFNRMEERDFFKLVVEKVSGIGPKTALALLSRFPLEELVRFIAAKDTSFLASVAGIGKKTAEKVILELSDKVNDFAKNSIGGALWNSVSGDAILGLVALGYRRQDAETMIQNALKQDPEATVDQLIRRAIAVR
jgi:Holliday junction DNA helicase RuvA